MIFVYYLLILFADHFSGISFPFLHLSFVIKSLISKSNIYFFFLFRSCPFYGICCLFTIPFSLKLSSHGFPKACPPLLFLFLTCRSPSLNCYTLMFFRCAFCFPFFLCGCSYHMYAKSPWCLLTFKPSLIPIWMSHGSISKPSEFYTELIISTHLTKTSFINLTPSFSLSKWHLVLKIDFYMKNKCLPFVV